MCWNKKEGRLSVGGFLLRLILVIIFVLLLMWLCPMLRSTTYNNSVFSDNVDRIKDAASSYFTNERLPKEVGESTKISLEQMLIDKMLLPIVDGKGRACNEEKSFVRIDKKATEYVMTVYLSCEEEADFVEIHMGCYDKCNNFDLSKQNIEYQYKKTSQKTKKIAYCPTTYTLRNGKCQKGIVEEDLIDATKTLKCDSGYSLSNGKCITTSNTTTAKMCPSGYTKNATSTECTKTTTTTTSLLTKYTCPSGYVRSGTKCTKDTTAFAGYTNLSSTYLAQACDTCAKVTHYLYATTATTTKYCPSGYAKNSAGTSCYKDVVTTTNLVCPSGYEDKNGICSASQTVTKEATIVLSCPTGYTMDGNECMKETGSILTTKVLYKNKTYTTTSYKWSEKSSLSGWLFTGKTRSTTACTCNCK